VGVPERFVPLPIAIITVTLILALPIASAILYVLGSIQKGRLVKRTADREEADGLYD
jgi:hypothetical protein